jgi:hypothetical protein
MPRPRKNDPTPLLKPLLVEFARAISDAVERMTLERVQAILDQSGGLSRGGGGGARATRGRRAKVLCYYPGCKNVAAPRFGMFCAAEHKNLPSSEKEKFRRQRLASGNGNGAAEAAPAAAPAAAAKRARASKKAKKS